MIIYAIAGLVSAILCYISSAYVLKTNTYLFLGFFIIACCELSGALVSFYIGDTGPAVRMEVLRIAGYAIIAYVMYAKHKNLKAMETQKTKVPTQLLVYEPISAAPLPAIRKFSKSHIALNELNKTLSNLKSYAEN